MQKFIYLLFMAALSGYLVGCSQKVEMRNRQSDMISGSIGGVGASSFSKTSQKIGKLAACNQTEVLLHRLTDQGEVGELVAQTDIDSEGKFLFKGLSEKGAIISNVSSSMPSFVLRFTCDGEVLSRFVTGSSAQDIDFATTLLSWFSQTPSSQKVLQVPSSKWNELYTSLAGSSSVADVYQVITNNSGVRAKVEQAGLLPAELDNAYPVLRSITAPTTFNEQSPNVLNALVHHWNPSYDFAYEWRLNGQLIANTQSYTYVPGSNSQGDYTLQLFIGKNNGSGMVDTTSPYVYRVLDVKINNSVLPVVPATTLLSGTPTNSTSAQIRLNTGAVAGSTFANCRSFSQFAIVEDSTLAVALPPLFSDFTHTCTTATNQDISFTLSGTPGPRVLRLWAVDAAGVISATPQELFVDYDIGPPSLNITSPAALAVSQNGLTLAGTCETGLAITVSGSGITGTTATCVGSAFSVALSFTAGDGVKAVQISQTDAAGNSSTATRSFTRDTDAPDTLISSPAASTRRQSDVTLSGTCETGLTVTIGGTGAVATTTACTAGTFSEVVNLTSGDGAKAIQVSQTDGAGNTGTDSRSFIRDSTPPNLTITAPALNTATKNQITLAGACETGLTVNVGGAGAVATTATCTASAYSVVVTLSATDGDKEVTVTQTDVAGNVANASRNFIRDTTAPTLTFARINAGESTTGNRNVVLSVNANSSRVDIESLCIKMNDSVAPVVGDSCWTSLTAIAMTITDSLTLSNYPYQVGSLLGTYTLRIWLKDQLGNISINADAAAVDQAAIYYEPDPPPVIASLTVTSSDVVSQPLVEADMIVPYGSDMYVKWNVTDNAPIPSGKISLHYTTDEVNYTLLEDGLNNSGNGGCTVDPGTTGCIRLTAASPLNTYFKIRLSVEDVGSFTALSTSNPLNTGKFTVLSGNTSLGIGGSATSAILLGRNESTTDVDNQAFVITKKGDIFFNYDKKGLAHVSPTTGILTIISPDTNASTGDGGALASATFNQIGRIILDYNDNLLIWDSNRVRKVDLSTPSWTISTLFGGGGVTTSGAAATSAQLPSLSAKGMFTVLPNGRVYFEKVRQVWYFDPSDTTVKMQMELTGMGLGSNAGALATFDWSVCSSENTVITYDKSNSTITKILRRGTQSTSASCTSHPNSEPTQNANFNLSTGVTLPPHPPATSWSSVNLTGMDGRFYSINNNRNQLLRYDPGTNAMVRILGVSDTGRCGDNTLATSCAANIMSAFVNEFGRVYFLDMGVIRTIDDSGRVQTIAGQARNYGAGENPASARYGLLNFFDIVGDDVYVLNKNESQIMKFSLAGGTLQHIAGNGVVGGATHDALAVNQPLSNGGWSQPLGFRVDGAAQRLYYRSTDKFAYINLATGKWHVSSTQIQDGSARPSYLGIGPDRLLAYVQTHSGSAGNNVNLREVNFATGASPVVYGQNATLTTLAGDLCDGVVGTTCTLSSTLSNFSVQTRAKYDSTLNSWIIGYYGKNYVNVLPLGGGTTSRLEVMARGVWSFDTAYSGADLMIYYCGNNGRLYKRNTTTNVETELALPSTTITCDGQSVHYHSGRNSVIFIYKQNDMYGVAEYTNP